MRSCRTLQAGALAALIATSALTHAPLADAQVSADEDKVRARAHFERGLAHVDREEWQAALAEFLHSRELQPTRGNTKNAAFCLRKLKRFDESIAVFEEVLSFPNLEADERRSIEREIADLNASVGVLELRGVPEGASVTVDGAPRSAAVSGVLALRLSAGSHELRVVQDGSLPFVHRLDLAGAQRVSVQVALSPLTRASRLRVLSRDGSRLELYIDGARVGATPWDGALAPGAHTLRSVGAERLGTAPQRIALDVDEQRELVLSATVLGGPLEVNTKPPDAEIVINGVPVGRGTFHAGLPAGTHRVVVRSPGFRTVTYSARVFEDASCALHAELDPLERPRFSIELRGGVFAGIAWGGDLRAGCRGACSASAPLGGAALLHARYRGTSGFGAGVHAGYLGMSERIEQRRATITAQGREPREGSVDDALAWHNLLVGLDGEYAWGGDWSWVLSMAIGAMLGETSDTRTGHYRNSDDLKYTASRTIVDSAHYLYVAPEFRVERELGYGFSLSVGLQAFVLTALHRPTWQHSDALWTGSRDGLGYFPTTTLAGRLLFLPQPFLGGSYTF